MTSMQLNTTAFAIPAVLLFMGLEYAYAVKKKRTDLFRFDNSVTNISIGIAERLLYLFLAASFYQLFQYIYKHYAWWQVPNKWYVWIVLILFADFLWYWYHRLGHEVNLFWGAHIVHHQSEDFNYTVSARITVLQALVRNVFWCIMPLVGFHPDMVITILLVHGAYSFFTHTQVIGKLGFLEDILITPSHHRVHHASNAQYLDKNYGDIFVFWDKLFGTFKREEEQPVYGLTKPLRSYSFLWQHFHFYIEMAVAIKHAKGLKAKSRILFGKPELIDPTIGIMLERRLLKHKVRTQSSYRFRAYLNLQLSLCLLVLFGISLFYSNVVAIDKLFAAAFILLTLINCGAMLEQRRWIYYLEGIRVVLLITIYSYYAQSLDVFLLLNIIFLLIIITLPVKHWYRRYLLR